MRRVLCRQCLAGGALACVLPSGGRLPWARAALPAAPGITSSRWADSTSQTPAAFLKPSQCQSQLASRLSLQITCSPLIQKQMVSVCHTDYSFKHTDGWQVGSLSPRDTHENADNSPSNPAGRLLLFEWNGSYMFYNITWSIIGIYQSVINHRY